MTAEEHANYSNEWWQEHAQQLAAERDAAVQTAEQAHAALRRIEPVLDELIAWINTDMIGCLDVEARGEAARKIARAALAGNQT